MTAPRAAAALLLIPAALGAQPRPGVEAMAEGTRRELAPGLSTSVAQEIEKSLPHPSWTLEMDAALGVIGPAIGLAPGAPWRSEPVEEALRRLDAPVGVVLLPAPPADALPWVDGFFFAEGRILGWPAKGPLLTYSSEGNLRLAGPPELPEATVEFADGTRVPLSTVNGAPGEGWGLYTGPFSRTLVPTALFPAGTMFVHLRPDPLNTNPTASLWDTSLAPEQRRWRASSPVEFPLLNVGNAELALSISPHTPSDYIKSNNLSVTIPLPTEIALSIFSVEAGRWFASQAADPAEDSVRTLMATDDSGTRLWVLETGGGGGRRHPLGDKRVDRRLRQLRATRAVLLPEAGPRLSPGEVDAQRTRILSDRSSRAILGPVVRPPELASGSGERLRRLAPAISGASNLLQEHAGPAGLVDGRLGHDTALSRFWAAGPADDGKQPWVEFRFPEPVRLRAVDVVHAEACGFSPSFNLRGFRLMGRRVASGGWTPVAEVRRDAPVPRERIEIPSAAGPVEWIRLEVLDPAFQSGCPTARLGELVFWGTPAD